MVYAVGVDGWEFSPALRRAQEGDEEALDEIYRRYSNAVLARIRGRLRGDMKALYQTTDIAQSVFLEVMKDLEKFEDRGEAAFLGWLRVKCENKIRKKLRKHLDNEGRQREVHVPTGWSPPARNGAGPATAAGDAEHRSLIRARLADLNDDQREVIRLRLEEKMSFREIAEQLSLPSDAAARMRFARAIVELRDRLGTSGDP